jgi:uncharacterized membrane protein
VAEESARQQTEEQDSDEEQDPSRDGSDENGRSRLSQLRGRDILLPAAATAAAAAAAGLAAKKGPDLLRMLGSGAKDEAEDLGREGAKGVGEQMRERGGIAGTVMSKALGVGGRAKKGGKTRRLPIQRWTDLAVPVEKAYQAWTNFEEYPKFMHRVLNVEREENNKVHWQEKIWFSTREWEAEITERRKNDRIAWKSVQGTQHSGLVSFHKLDTNLTRMFVTIDFVPSGMIEKMASGMRFVKRAVEADLARFKAYVELGDVKGLEYAAKPEEMEQHRSDDDSGDEAEADAREGEGSQAEASGEAAQDDSSDQSNGDRESGRRDRESRRQERRESLTGSRS